MQFGHIVSDCNVVGGEQGIHFKYIRAGRPSGEAYIELASEEDLNKALAKDRAYIGERYIEGRCHIIHGP